MRPLVYSSSRHNAFQYSSASRKFLNLVRNTRPSAAAPAVSVLFSEPKIPQSRPFPNPQKSPKCFSTLQRAENSSINARGSRRPAAPTFQYSSASRKFLNAFRLTEPREGTVGFSTLQRAENSSIERRTRRTGNCRWFQYSSASRKFLNGRTQARPFDVDQRFSTLQRAENSSIPAARTIRKCGLNVSVLFSEPKIPQCGQYNRSLLQRQRGFSTLQRAENSSITVIGAPSRVKSEFQYSSASRKFLNFALRCRMLLALAFQYSSASRKFLNIDKRCGLW